MKKWITMLGVMVSLIILLLFLADDKRAFHKKITGSPAVRLEK